MAWVLWTPPGDHLHVRGRLGKLPVLMAVHIYLMDSTQRGLV